MGCSMPLIFSLRSVDPLKRNQFGGTFGGPVEIPHLFKSKHTFFFVGYQKTILHDLVGGVSSFLPTQAIPEWRLLGPAERFKPE